MRVCVSVCTRMCAYPLHVRKVTSENEPPPFCQHTKTGTQPLKKMTSSSLVPLFNNETHTNTHLASTHTESLDARKTEQIRADSADDTPQSSSFFITWDLDSQSVSCFHFTLCVDSQLKLCVAHNRQKCSDTHVVLFYRPQLTAHICRILIPSPLFSHESMQTLPQSIKRVFKNKQIQLDSVTTCASAVITVAMTTVEVQTH